MFTAKGISKKGREWEWIQCSEGLHAAHLGDSGKEKNI